MTETQPVARRGRPWGPLQGAGPAINDLAHLLRIRLDAAGLSLNDLYAQLVPENFRSGQVPSRSTIARRLSGVGLESDWDFVEAVVDLTTRDADECERVLRHARQFWDAANRLPAPAAPGTADDPEDPPAVLDPSALDGRTLAIRNATFHGPVHITTNHYPPAGSDHEITELREQLLDARRRLTEALTRLNEAHRELASTRRELDDLRSLCDRLLRAGARPTPDDRSERFPMNRELLRKHLEAARTSEQDDA
ncbi:hypothetical protein [Streptomyces caatingaensis]|uniref:Uncharacterized protein n=1 Tax=Streptomyces caatingaensis TaxID=1678637 RepID=A0A0K9XHX6_9ACTN|nr:hypothetical protein [Streptomyces caatingaensis]KNB52888.1 hypothetical protein AC230_09670 [Streptomyces caatingaensis]